MTLVLILLGALPFVFGGVQNWYMTTHMDSLLPYTLIAFAVLLIWGLLAFFFNQDGTQTKRIVVCLNLIAAVDLFLIGVQELILHAYWMNLIGAWSQFFYLPVLHRKSMFELPHPLRLYQHNNTDQQKEKHSENFFPVHYRSHLHFSLSLHPRSETPTIKRKLAA